MLMLQPRLTTAQAEKLKDIESATRYFKTQEFREGITFQDVLDKAGVKYHSFHWLVTALEERGTTTPLIRLARLLREIDVLKKVPKLAPYAKEEDEDMAPLPETPVSRRAIRSPDEEDIEASIEAQQIIARALKPLSPDNRESTLLAIQRTFRIGVS